MTPPAALKSLQVIRHRLDKILTSESLRVLQETEAKMRAEASDFNSNMRKWQRLKRLWGYVVFPSQPIEFHSCRVREYDIHVDLHCSFKWIITATGTIPTEQNLVLRVWSSDKRLTFRKEWDSDEIKGQLEGIDKEGKPGKRVMLRYHFDLANSKQPGPKYHLQVGGVARGDELCWLPSEINLPRFACPPIDLALACEMVAANFFPTEYREIKKEPEWRRMILDVQASILRDYFRGCHESIGSADKDKCTLLDALWESVGDGASLA
jgi:hypothetical protein